jgi:uncharacterized protein YqeY
MSTVGAADGQDSGMRARLSRALRDALRGREPVATAALRSALAAIGNAEAVSAGRLPAAGTSSPHFAGAAAGLGAAEVPRRALSEADVESIVRAEIAERQLAARQYAEAGHDERAAQLRAQAAVLEEAANLASET